MKNIKKHVFGLVTCIPFLLNAQQYDNGIKWTTGLTWEQVKQKAKSENKYIFIDCYATWCGPCKLMDKRVYPNDTIGALMNSQFINLKLQIDSTKNDNEEIRKWYKNVKVICKEYVVTAMPTFLFFAPNGKIIHKEVGGKSVKQFISLIESVTNPSEQYYTLVGQFKEGKLGYTELPFFANKAYDNGEIELAYDIARRYMTGYLDKNERNYFIKDNQQLIYKFLAGILRSTDKLFLLYFHQPEKMDTLLGKHGSSQRIVDHVITKEEITPIINVAKDRNKEPAWEKIARDIRKKFGSDYAKRLVLNARVDFYKLKKEWLQYSKYLVQKVQMEKEQRLSNYSSSTFLNQYAWEIFLYSNRKQDLRKALGYSNRSLQLIDSSHYNVGSYLDTKANILYKLDRTDEAMAIEEQSIQRLTIDSEKYKFMKGLIEKYKEILQNMKEGKPTYLAEGAIWEKYILVK